MRPARKIIGIQVHHSVNLDDASRFGANMLTALDAAAHHMDEVPPEYIALRDQLGVAVRDIGAYRTEAGARLRQFWEDDPINFVRARDGYIPWPDENDHVVLRDEPA